MEAWASTITGAAVLVDEDGSSEAQAAAAWLRSEGLSADVLEGGTLAWRAAGLPMLEASKLPRRDASGGTLWVTRSRPKVDRIACPWLIRRFVDPRARFLFAPAADVLSVARQVGATPFDVAHPDVYWSHLGERCTFDLMVEAFGRAGWEIPAPPASMFAWAPLPPAVRDMGSLEFSKQLLTHAGVAVAPGVGYGEDGEGFERIAIVENEQRLRQAARNVKRFLAGA